MSDNLHPELKDLKYYINDTYKLIYSVMPVTEEGAKKLDRALNNLRATGFVEDSNVK